MPPQPSAGSAGSLQGPGLRTDTEPQLTCVATRWPWQSLWSDALEMVGEGGAKQQRGDRVQQSGFLSSPPLSPQRIHDAFLS